MTTFNNNKNSQQTLIKLTEREVTMWTKETRKNFVFGNDNNRNIWSRYNLSLPFLRRHYYDEAFLELKLMLCVKKVTSIKSSFLN